MRLSGTSGRNSEQRNQLHSTSSAPITISDSTQIPNTFHFWNGDEYVGQFAVIKEKQKVIMQGKGVYTTSDGQIYEGLWDNDCLKDECKIKFPGRLTFSGNLEDMIVQGMGKYAFQEKVEIEGYFVDNSLTGRVDLKDPNNHFWRGKVDKKKSCVNFYPLHSFWQSVLNLPLKTIQVFYGEGEEGGENVWEVY